MNLAGLYLALESRRKAQSSTAGIGAGFLLNGVQACLAFLLAVWGIALNTFW